MAVLEGVGGFLFVLLGTLEGDYEDPGHLPLLGHHIFLFYLATFNVHKFYVDLWSTSKLFSDDSYSLTV